MKLNRIFLSFVVLLCFSLIGFTQQQPENIQALLNSSYDQAMHYKEVSLYGESIGELDKVIRLAQKHGFQEDVIKASIAKAELFRKTENFERGIELLFQLKDTEKYPKLHVKKLGRLAAIFAQSGILLKKNQQDSILVFIYEGIDISTRLGLDEEEASLRNELGFLQSRNHEYESALQNLQTARKLYHEINDEENEMGVCINILDLHISKHDFRKGDSLHPILTERIKNKGWYGMENKLYAMISIRYKADNDSIREYYWEAKSHRASASNIRLMNSNQMASFEVIHETEKFKDDALKKSNALKLQKGQTQRLLLFIAILILAVIIVILIFFREKRLKSKLDITISNLNTMNNKYEMLIVESNHRIKNNLQMIISMLEFTRKGLENSDTDIIQSMSGKIQTISALHKHLYIDIHNERVDLNLYFNEILKHYMNIGLKYTVSKSISSVEIRSERIVYFGLILNELLSNTLEHGTSNELQVILSVKAKSNGFVFTYSDGSAHLPDMKEGTGTKLIKQLVGRINGTDYQMLQETGTYQFNFEADN